MHACTPWTCMLPLHNLSSQVLSKPELSNDNLIINELIREYLIFKWVVGLRPWLRHHAQVHEDPHDEILPSPKLPPYRLRSGYRETLSVMLQGQLHAWRQLAALQNLRAGCDAATCIVSSPVSADPCDCGVRTGSCRDRAASDPAL